MNALEALMRECAALADGPVILNHRPELAYEHAWRAYIDADEAGNPAYAEDPERALAKLRRRLLSR